MGSDKVLTDNIDIILTHMPIAVTIQNTAGALVYANGAAARMIGFKSPEDLLQAPISEIMNRFKIYDELGNPLSLAALPGRQALQTQEGAELIIQFSKSDNDERKWSLVKALPILRKGVLAGAINTFYDLTPLKITEQKLRFLTHATSTLAESLNYEQRLQKLANLIVPQFADWCTIHMLDVDGTLKRIAIAHSDRKMLARVEKLTKKYPSGIGSSSAVSQVMKSGKMKLFPLITDDMLEEAVINKEQLALLKDLRLRSVAIVPLIAREKTIGAITFVQSANHPGYSDKDMNFFWSLATKAALLVDNARLHRTMLKEVEKGRTVLKKLRDNEKALRLALDIGHMGIWDWDVQNDQLLNSPSLQNFPTIPGYKGQISYKEFLNRLDPLDRPRWEKNMSQTLAHTGPYESELRIQYPDRTRHWIYGKGEILADDTGRPTRVIGVGIDITKRKRTETILRQSEKKFKTIFSTALDSMIIFDDELRIRDANPAACDMFRMTRSALIQKILLQLVPKDQRQKWEDDLHVIITKGSKRGEIEISSTNASKYTLEYNAMANILPHRHMIVMRDITERKLEEKRSEHFLGIASHELKSPLASIKAMAQLLKTLTRKSKDTTEEKYLDKIDKKVDLVAYLINDLLDVTRIRQGKMEFIYELFDIDSLIQSTIEETQMTAKDHTITAHLKADKDIVGDRLRISQVLHNIIRNAMKYSPKNTHITISSVSRKDSVIVSIKDEGPGIPPQERTKVFDLYYRSAPSKDQLRLGLGVGLYISSQIVKQHGGEIWVEGGRKTGAIFCIQLPIRPKKESKTRTLF